MKLYNKPEVEIVMFAAMEAITAPGETEESFGPMPVAI